MSRSAGTRCAMDEMGRVRAGDLSESGAEPGVKRRTGRSVAAAVDDRIEPPHGRDSGTAGAQHGSARRGLGPIASWSSVLSSSSASGRGDR